ncbi:type II toxin-antitoxin system HicB family antitoxin [Actinopolymorpha alba]|uniref:type II toxin-antitoxin system HicB family antitoxin n=1 Tax=Actinopolymorpha alba TaxID=533267 RepID=UPI00039E2EC1|nr:type II toxin-antitoxin system HicB family antitoxin [Actinopolymorpha alba]
MTTYRIVVTREGDNWLADVPELQGAHTFARTLPALDRYIREVITLAADLPDEAMPSLVLDWDFRTGDPMIDNDSARVRALRSRAQELAEQVNTSTVDAAQRLVARGVSVRDAAILLGVSPQRISQVTGGHAKAS